MGLQNIVLQDITISEASSWAVCWSESPGLLQDICLANISLRIRKGRHTETLGGNFDLRPTGQPENSVFKHDIPKVFARQVRTRPNLLLRKSLLFSNSYLTLNTDKFFPGT